MAKYLLPVHIDKGDGPAVILLHGLGNNYRSWSYASKYIHSVRLVAVDLLGFGDAPKPNISYTAADHADAVINTLESLDIKKAVIAGHSMGCIIAIEIALKRPDLVKHLVLAGAPIYQKQIKATKLGKLFHTENTYFALYNFLADHPDITKTGGDIADNVIPFIRGMEINNKTWPAFRKSLENTIMQYDTFDKAIGLTVPALFLNGIFDFFIVRSINEKLVRANRQYLHAKLMLGPHELTPRQGRRIARIIRRLALK